MDRIVVVCLCVIFIGTSEALYKKWKPNTNFDNPANWNAGRLPCQNDAIKFPQNIPSVFVQTNATMQEMLLPMNGELILSDFMSFSFVSETDESASCIGQDMEFTATTARSWFDPDNWCEVTGPEGSCMSETPERLPTERLPCRMDVAVLPAPGTFLVDLQSGVDVHLGKLIIGSRYYMTGRLQSYLRTDEGRRAFQQSGGGISTSVNVADSLCTDPTGCPCGNDGGLLEEKVCETARMTCPNLLCVQPVRPEGGCCHLCGSILRMTYGVGFKLKSLENAISSTISKVSQTYLDLRHLTDIKPSVRVVISRLASEEIQVVIEDVDGTGTAGRLATAIKDKVQPDDTGFSRYRIVKVDVTTTDTMGSRHTGPQSQTGSKKWGAGSIASLVVSLVAIIVIILIVMYCFIDRKRPDHSRRKFNVPLQWPFRRFSEDRRTFELGPSLGFKDNISFGGGMAPVPENIRGFDNPTYGGDPYAMNGQPVEGASGQTNNNTAAGISTVDVTDPTFVHKGPDSGFSNPLYGNMPKMDDTSYLDASLKMNPMFSAEGLEEDSEI